VLLLILDELLDQGVRLLVQVLEVLHGSLHLLIVAIDLVVDAVRVVAAVDCVQLLQLTLVVQQLLVYLVASL